MFLSRASGILGGARPFERAFGFAYDSGLRRGEAMIAEENEAAAQGAARKPFYKKWWFWLIVS